MSKVSVVLGAGFGDEGKGKVTNFLAKQDPKRSMVIRFNGGHQAGHTVVQGNTRHVFSSFGSGTLSGVPSFTSRFCTIYPPAVVGEYGDLRAKDVNPILYVDPMAMVTTPFDIYFNRKQEVGDKHGSCGAGFGKTVERHETIEHSHRIFAKDLNCEWVLRQKLKTLSDKTGILSIDLEGYIQNCLKAVEMFEIVPELDIFLNKKIEHFVFEGAQGILLDREHGIFPHVTRSSTTSKNVFQMIHPFLGMEIKVYYLSRCYQTRHGYGPLLGSEHGFVLKNNENETNVTNEWQGEFRKAPLSLSLLKYALDSDISYYNRRGVQRELLFSHLDQLECVPLLTKKGDIFYADKAGLIELASNTLKIPITTHDNERL